MAVVKVTLVGGAGGVGASTAFNLVLMQRSDEIVLVDSRPEMITSHAMDFEQALELSPGSSVRGGDMGDVPDADVVVFLSATPLIAGTPRLEYLARNALIADELAAELGAGYAGKIVVVTNPWYPRHVALDSGRSSTWTSGLGVARMVAALDGDGELWPASVVLDGEYGIEGVALTVPVTIGRGGAEQIHEWELGAADLTALRAAAELVRAAVASVDPAGPLRRQAE